MFNVECRMVQIFEHLTKIFENLTSIFKQTTHPIGLLFLVTIIPLGAYLG
jgi:hypothetical protein